MTVHLILIEGHELPIDNKQNRASLVAVRGENSYAQSDYIHQASDEKLTRVTDFGQQVCPKSRRIRPVLQSYKQTNTNSLPYGGRWPVS